MKENRLEIRIKGRVNTYSEAVNSGVLITNDDKTYLFSHKDWLSSLPPVSNLPVSFIANKNWAKSILPDMDDPDA